MTWWPLLLLLSSFLSATSRMMGLTDHARATAAISFGILFLQVAKAIIQEPIIWAADGLIWVSVSVYILTKTSRKLLFPLPTTWFLIMAVLCLAIGRSNGDAYDSSSAAMYFSDLFGVAATLCAGGRAIELIASDIRRRIILMGSYILGSI